MCMIQHLFIVKHHPRSAQVWHMFSQDLSFGEVGISKMQVLFTLGPVRKGFLSKFLD